MYQPAYRTAAQLMEEQARGYRGSTRGFDPRTGISPYYDPYETDVVEDTLERMRRQSAQQDIAGRAQDISSGAFVGRRKAGRKRTWHIRRTCRHQGTRISESTGSSNE